LFVGLVINGPALAYAVPDTAEDCRMLSAAGASIRLAQAQPSPAAAPSPAPAPAPATPSARAASSAEPSASDEPIGNVATLTGTASVIRNQNTLPLKLKDDIYLNDTLVTFSDSALGVTFNDATTFNLTANASIKVDDFVYQDGGQQNSALFDIAKGTVAFVASAVARTGNMKIATPTATLGIRGTTGLVEVNGAGAHNIKLYPDPDGHVGTIEVADRNGARLGTLTRGASGFTIRPGVGGRFTATPLAISPREAARDQGIVRQVHAAQNVGRQVVNEQRALRRANPNRPQGAPGQQRQNNPQQRQNNQQQRGPRQPGLPNNRSGQQGRPGEPSRAGQQGQPGQPNRAGEQGRPETPNRATEQGRPGRPNRETRQGQPQQPPGVQRPNAPELRQGGLPNRPAAPRRAPPTRKPPKEKR
jgi:FecR-like protein